MLTIEASPCFTRRGFAFSAPITSTLIITYHPYSCISRKIGPHSSRKKEMRRPVLGKKPGIVTDTPRWHCRGPRVINTVPPALTAALHYALYSVSGGRGPERFAPQYIEELTAG